MALVPAFRPKRLGTRYKAGGRPLKTRLQPSKALTRQLSLQIVRSCIKALGSTRKGNAVSLRQAHYAGVWAAPAAAARRRSNICVIASQWSFAFPSPLAAAKAASFAAASTAPSPCTAKWRSASASRGSKARLGRGASAAAPGLSLAASARARHTSPRHPACHPMLRAGLLAGAKRTDIGAAFRPELARPNHVGVDKIL